MSERTKVAPTEAIVESNISRVIPCKRLDVGDPLKWLAFALNDFKSAPLISLSFGIIFAIIPMFISYLVVQTGFHFVAMPALTCFIMLGPVLAASLYDVSWELEKGHKPSFLHSLKAIKRNAVNEWAFAFLLLFLMIFWLRVAALIHALYPPHIGENYEQLLPFLTLGTIVGATLTSVVFMLSAFTQPILMERKVDLMTAILSSVNAVWQNKATMFIWALIILTTVAIGFLTAFVGFVVLMPLIGYATWHSYIDTIEIKRERKYK
jgi:uncharacterized membrane protein